MTEDVIIAQARLPLADPHDCTDAADELSLYEALYDTLVRREGRDYVPRLAVSWAMSEDASTWTFRLREGVAFQDGSLCDAEAVRRSLERMAREDKGYTLGAPGVWRQYLGDAIIETPDAATLTIRLGAPMADLLDVLVQGYVVAPSALPAYDAGDTHRPCGTGAYRLIEASDDHALMARVPGHFAGEPANDRIRFVREPDRARRLAMVRAGSAQVATNLDVVASADLAKDGATQVVSLAPVAIIYLLNAASGPLADARVRRALALALDREALIEEVVPGAARPLHGFVSPLHYGAGDAPARERDPESARALLAEAGFADGLTLGLDCPARLPDEAERLTQALGRQLAAIGVTLDVHLHADREAYAHMVRRKEIRDLCVFDSSPMSTYRVLVEKLDARVRGSWWQGYSNAAVEALIDRGRTTVDRAARSALYAQAYALLQDDPAWLCLYNPLKATGISGNHPDFALPVDTVLDVARLPPLR
ncbi:ABC transporter substrate-binding protein [Salinarimonas ramus]|uniref:ABC transporter substrate-binding protein n=1 Tax=Salinarimonas ramus TaxID=690164 RepID=A0A917Q8G6_9HYPH|nr:ABC transporter substrate-binding protein [Salinarimonas ramus]GGK31954.1 ABC transporter substrate-binding protein [Salinarimonas ramus]